MAQITTRIAAFAALFLALNIGCSSAQDRRQNEPGQFDFYVLSLSWSPSFCDAATERSPDRAARATVKIPPDYLDLAEPKTVSPKEVEDAFVAANPGLTHEAIAIGCDAKRLNEVRICLSKDLKFRNCAEVARRACRRDQVVMPRVRGTQGAAPGGG